MDELRLTGDLNRLWTDEIMPPLIDYVAIPCESPDFDPDWARNGHMDRATALMADWARRMLGDVPGAVVDVLSPAGLTPLIFVDIPGDEAGATLIYGHLDKQPPMAGWTHGRGAWTPRIEGDRLYGRGGADDGYAIFSAVAAVLALREQGLSHPRTMILIEASEESGSPDLAAHVEALAPRLGEPALVIALDAGCGNYDQLWVTTSVRGQVAGTLSVRTLDQGAHSGDASGVAPSPFRIACHLISRLEDPATGEVAADFQVAIPLARRRQAEHAAAALGAGVYDSLAFSQGVRPVSDDLTELALNRAWRPQLTVTGLDGLPAVASAAAVLQPALALKLSLRLPPTLDPHGAAARLKALLEADPPYGAQISFRIDMVSTGWNAPAVAPWLAASLDAASLAAFGAPSALMGGGGGIPFLAMLGEMFPSAQFVVTGVLGPESNAHGPNEFLHLPTARRVTAAVARLLHDATKEVP